MSKKNVRDCVRLLLASALLCGLDLRRACRESDNSKKNVVSRHSRTMHVSRSHTPLESRHWTCHCASEVSQHNSIGKIRLSSQNASRSMLHSARSSWVEQSDHIADGRHSDECSSVDDLSPQWLLVAWTRFREHMMKWSSVSQKDHQYVVKRFVATYIIVWRASCDSSLATGMLSAWRWAWYCVPLHDETLLYVFSCRTISIRPSISHVCNVGYLRAHSLKGTRKVLNTYEK